MSCNTLGRDFFLSLIVLGSQLLAGVIASQLLQASYCLAVIATVLFAGSYCVAVIVSQLLRPVIARQLWQLWYGVYMRV